jgi:phosphatidate phosphatase LPIN
MSTYLDRLLTSLSSALEINAATLSGAADIIVVQQPDGSLHSTPFHVRFGKLQLLKSREKVVEIEVSPLDESDIIKAIERLERIPSRERLKVRLSGTFSSGDLQNDQNLEPALGGYKTPLTMLLGAAGEAFFVEEATTETVGELEQKAPPDVVWVERAPSEPPSPCSETLREWRASQEPSALSSDPEDIQSAFSDSEQPNRTERLQLPPVQPADLETSSPLGSSWGARLSSILRRRSSREEPSRSESSSPVEPPPPIMDASLLGETGPMLSNPDTTASSERLQVSVERQRSNTTGAIEPLLFDFDEGAQENAGRIALGATTRDLVGFERGSNLSRQPSDALTGEAPVALSLCGHLVTPHMTTEQVHDLFEANRISLDYFQNHVNILQHPDLLVRIHDQLYPYRVAAPLLVGLLAFGTMIDARLVDRQTVAPKARPPRARFTWFGLRSSHLEDASSEPLQIGEPLTETVGEQKNVVGPSVSTAAAIDPHPLPLHRPRYMRKSLCPSSAQLAQLGLRPGANLITFTVHSRLQGVQRLSSRIYLWPHDVKLCVSDVDGTITRSDVLGQILPRVGKDWSHQGVASLYRAIARNGYKFVYLTSRAIGQASATRSYLTTLQQEGSLGLPDGPLLLSPDRVIESFAREVLRRRPQDFKIAALEQVRRLFPPGGYNPFFAGFGNRDSDRIAYAAMGIPPERVFLVNSRGELQVGNHVFDALSSFGALKKLVDSIFPDISRVSGQEKITEVHEAQEFNDYQYWKRPFSPGHSSSGSDTRFSF